MNVAMEKQNSLNQHQSLHGDKVSELTEATTPSKCNADKDAFPDAAQLEQNILESIPKGTFLVTCQDLSFSAGKSDECRQTLLQMLARLHNEGKIDCLKEMARFCDETGKQSLPHFGLWIAHFRPLFSKLVCPIESICNLFASFDKHLQRDMVPGIWWDSLLERFRTESDTRREMLRLAEAHDTFCPGLRVAFSAGLSSEREYWFKTAIELLENPGERSKQFFNTILLALWDADWKTLDSASQSAFWKVIAAITEDNNPPFDWCFLYLICHQLRMQRLGGIPCETILQRVLSFNDPGVLARAAIHLAVDWAGTDTSERQWSLEAFSKINPATDNLSPHLDGFLEMLVHNGFMETATNFLTSYLVHWQANLAVFPQVVQMLQHRIDQLGPTTTSWFLSGNPILETAVSELIPFEFEDHPIPAIDIKQISKTQQSLLPVAAKIIGHLFYKPKTMISFLLPCLDFMDAKEKKAISSVLFDPVCLSYHGEIRKWMESDRCNLGKDSRVFLNEILGRAKTDTDFLSKAGSYPELGPPMQLHAELERVQQNEKRNYMQEAYKNSLIPFLTHNISMLHGKSWIQYRMEEDGSLARSAQDLQHLSASYAVPCLPNAVGLAFNWLLAALRMGYWNVDTVREFCE